MVQCQATGIAEGTSSVSGPDIAGIWPTLTYTWNSTITVTCGPGVISNCYLMYIVSTLKERRLSNDEGWYFSLLDRNCAMSGPKDCDASSLEWFTSIFPSPAGAALTAGDTYRLTFRAWPYDPTLDEGTCPPVSLDETLLIHAYNFVVNPPPEP